MSGTASALPSAWTRTVAECVIAVARGAAAPCAGVVLQPAVASTEMRTAATAPSTVDAVRRLSGIGPAFTDRVSLGRQ